jgi:DNA-binding response OmpR family regulator
MTPLDFIANAPGLSNVVCLQKPFRPGELMAAIAAARGTSTTT